VSIKPEKIELTDKILIKTELLSYKPRDIKKLPVDKKSVTILKKAVKENPLALIDYWCIDYDYDGVLLRPDEVFVREKGVLKTCCEKISSRCGNIAVRIVDIFGDSTLISENLSSE